MQEKESGFIYEVWHHYAGEGVRIHLLENGQYRMLQLGKNIEKGELPVVWVPKGIWFAAEPAEGCDFSLMGCTVSPGFDFADFEMAFRSWAARFPQVLILPILKWLTGLI